MKYNKLFEKINYFYKLAGAPEFLKLREPSDRKRLSGELWFGDRMAQVNNDMRNFAILDNRIVNALKKIEEDYGIIGTYDVSEINAYYLKHPKTQELIRYICNSYNNKFPGRNAYEVAGKLENDGQLDPDSGIVQNPIFILIHDLIHQIIEPDFVQQLQDQESGEVITLMDEISEDIASSLSGFQPTYSTAGQGLVSYLKRLFNKYVKETGKTFSVNLSLSDLIEVINKTIHEAKAELRGKLAKFEGGQSPEYREKVKKIPPEMRQLVDGILSKIKKQMLDKAKNDIFDSNGQYQLLNTNSRIIAVNGPIWRAFDLDEIFREYNEKILESRIISQSDSSALRGWMISCLAKMKELLNYFEYELLQEISIESDEEEEENEEEVEF